MAVKQVKKRNLREMAAQDKARMLPLNFAFTYFMIPAYVILAIILFLLIGSLLQTSQTVPLFVCMAILAVLTVGFLCMFPLVRKKAVDAELKRYDLRKCRRESEQMESRAEWDFSDKELSVRFNRYGMVLDGELYYYNHLDKLVYTGNDYHRVGIYLCFSKSEDKNILMPLNAKALKMLSDCEVTLDNQVVLDDIFAHPREAFTEIYKTGKVDPERVQAEQT